MAELSLIVTFFDESAYIARALRSVLEARLDGLELILVNDNPQAFPPGRLQDLLPPGPIRVLHHEANQGIAAARNTGMAAASGRLIGFLDGDDFLLPGGFAAQLAMARDTGADITHAQASRKAAPASGHPPMLRDARYFAAPGLWPGLAAFAPAQFIQTSWSSLYRADFLAEHALAFDPQQRRFEDRLFLLETLSAAKSVAFTGQVARVWRRRKGSITTTAGGADNARLILALFEKCIGVVTREVAAGRLPAQMLARERFLTLARLAWLSDTLALAAGGQLGAPKAVAARLAALFEGDWLDAGLFDDPLLAPLHWTDRVGPKGQTFARADLVALNAALQSGALDEADRLIAAAGATGPAGTRFEAPSPSGPTSRTRRIVTRIARSLAGRSGPPVPGT